MGVIVLHRSRGWKDFLYVCVCMCACVCVCVYVCVCVCVCVYVCYHSTGRNFYPIYTKFGAQVGLIKSKVKFEDGLCRSQRDP